MNPILREKGLRSLLGVPLLVEGGVIGVMHIGTLTERKFGGEDVELLQSAGDRAALAISSRLTERERGLADALQGSLIPRLPELPGLGLGGRYLPAASAQLGGDWYDAFQLPDGTLGMAIGDVVGRGFHAAAVMGQLRSGLRAYALDGLAPGDVLGRLSRLLRQLEPGRTATVLYLVLDPYGGSLVVSSAGHPPPLIAGESGGRPEFVELPGSAPLGATRHPTYEEREHPLEPGSTLVLYTDGLVERARRVARRGARTAQGGRGGPHRGPGPSRRPPGRRAAAGGPGRGRRRAAPGARSAAERRRSSPSCPADVESIPLMRRLLGRWLHEAGATQAQAEDLALATSEACANAIEHAYGPAPGLLEVSGIHLAGRRGRGGRARLRQLATAARREPGPRAAADGGAHGLRRGRARRRRHDRAAVPAPGSGGGVSAQVEFDHRDSIGIARLSGDVDITQASSLRTQLLDAVRNDDLGLVVDLTDARYIDSVGVSLLFELAERLTGRQLRFAVVMPDKGLVVRVLTIVNLDSVAEVHRGLADALAAMRDA